MAFWEFSDSLSKEFLLFTLPRSVFDRRSPAALPTPLHTHTMPSARESTCARTPNRKDGDAETSGLRGSLDTLQRAKTADRDSRAIQKHSNAVEKAIRTEAEHVQQKIQLLQDALCEMSQQAVAGGIQKKLLLQIVARLDNDMTKFVNVLEDPKTTCSHRCQMGFMYFVCLICFMMIIVAGPLQFFGEVPAMQCLPWWMGYGNHEACLKWHSSKCPFGCAKSTKTCSGHVGGDTSNTFNINDIYYDEAAAKLLAPSILYIWRDVEGRTAPMPKAIMFTKFSATTTLAFCEHVKVSPSFLGHAWSGSRSCEKCIMASLHATLNCVGL